MGRELQRDFPVVRRKRQIGGIDRAPGQFLGGIFVAAERLGPRGVQEHGAVPRRLGDGVVDLQVRARTGRRAWPGPARGRPGSTAFLPASPGPGRAWPGEPRRDRRGFRRARAAPPNSRRPPARTAVRTATAALAFAEPPQRQGEVRLHDGIAGHPVDGARWSSSTRLLQAVLRDERLPHGGELAGHRRGVAHAPRRDGPRSGSGSRPRPVSPAPMAMLPSRDSTSARSRRSVSGAVRSAAWAYRSATSSSPRVSARSAADRYSAGSSRGGGSSSTACRNGSMSRAASSSYHREPDRSSADSRCRSSSARATAFGIPAVVTTPSYAVPLRAEFGDEGVEQPGADPCYRAGRDHRRPRR